MIARTLIVSLALGLAASSAAAQSAPPARNMVVDPRSNYDRLQSEGHNRAMTNRAANASPARTARAERMTALINEGKCDEAIAMAREEGDRRLAQRAEQVCRAPLAASNQ